MDQLKPVAFEIETTGFDSDSVIRQKTLPVTPPLGRGDSGNGCLAQPRVIQFSRTHGFQPRATAD